MKDSSFLVSKNNFIIIMSIIIMFPKTSKLPSTPVPSQTNSIPIFASYLLKRNKGHQASIKSQPGHDMITDRPKTAKQYSHPITQGLSMGKFNHTKLHLQTTFSAFSLFVHG